MNEPVLVLNRNFEPLNVCGMRRAIGLIVVGKAEILENGRGFIRTPTSVFPRPSVIRLAYMVRRPHPRVKLTKKEIFRRDDYRCQYCGQPSAHLTVDHVVPRHRGGTHSWSNLVSACPACNRRKGGKTLQEAHMSLLKQPTEPQASAFYLFGHHLKHNTEWRKFIEGW
ncbi:MAG: HNH endonuclease [Anaerolineae bacterium]|jgi:5-methylcytosine-specific restriction endonuclease McrA|nr:HNH endonuclease [Anaerolineae bacterium]MDH7472586.1 HNH endonuclease [Anaerolineae bacterium]